MKPLGNSRPQEKVCFLTAFKCQKTNASPSDELLWELETAGEKVAKDDLKKTELKTAPPSCLEAWEDLVQSCGLVLTFVHTKILKEHPSGLRHCLGRRLRPLLGWVWKEGSRREESQCPTHGYMPLDVWLQASSTEYMVQNWYCCLWITSVVCVRVV